jgi:hypothetical protein
MEIKVKAVDGDTQKSTAEIEEQLLKKHEDSLDDSVEKVNTQQDTPEDTSPETTDKVVEEEPKAEEKKESPEKVEENTPSSELNDENVLSFLKERYDRDINSVEELFETTESNPELPEAVSKFLEYNKETGRGIDDFAKLQKDYDSLDDDSLLADYYGIQEEGLDAIDIQDVLEDKFGFDEDTEEPRDIKRKKLAKKRELAKAKKFFNEQKDKYKVPLESSGGGLSEEQEKNLNAYQKYVENSKSLEDQQAKIRDYFVDRTEKLFTSDFKGFEYSVGDDKKITFKPGTNEELKNKQVDVNNLLSKFVDEKGLMTDAAGYHRALSVAMNPDKFAQFFYEQGVASAIDNVARKSKNINMDIRKSPQLNTKDALKIRSVGDKSSGRGLKIRSIKKV